MNSIQYNLQFKSLCNILQLGEVIEEPKAVAGGLLHRMFTIKTTKGKYAIKALNPQIMQRPSVKQHYINAEKIAETASKNIPALPAKVFHGSSLQELDNQFYLVFDWIEGKCLKADEINTAHCEKMGAVLADIHMTDFSELEITNQGSCAAELTDWNFYLHKGEKSNVVWFSLLQEISDKLYLWRLKANNSAKVLSSHMVVSHRDLDSKNVMWSQDSPLIIDWESAGFINPMQELIETAVYWSENAVGSLDKERFLSFIGGYKKRYGKFNADWEIVLLNGFSGKLDWLEYNLKRSLRIECTDEAEQLMGTQQVTETIKALMRYAEIISELELWLKDV